MSTSLAALRRAWNSEDSRFALRTKQFVASVLPERLLLEVKKRYYVGLLRQDSDELLEDDAHALPRLVRPGDFVIDVGAFVGFYSKRLSRLVGPTGMVWSFEPLPQTFQILAAGTRQLELTNVRLFPHAVSDREGVTMMEIPRFRGGGESWWDARIVRQRPGKASYRRFEITTRTLDSLLHQTERPVAFIKVDAEYHEYRCVLGAAESLRRWHPVIQAETLTTVDQEGTDLYKLLELLRTLGYAPYRFDGVTFHERERGERSRNLYFLCERHLRLLKREPRRVA